MKQIRRGVFETNSSSTHSICIATDRNTNLKFPEIIRFRCRNFGWERARYDDTEDKAAYLYASILTLFPRDEAERVKAKIWDWLSESSYIQGGIKCEFEEPQYEKRGNNYYCVNAYVDHAGSDEHLRFVRLVSRNKGRLYRYLFSKSSFIITGNDNASYRINYTVNYPHEEYYKGN